MSPAAAQADDNKQPQHELPLDDAGAAMEARFAELCKTSLSLDENIARQAIVLFRESKPVLLANMSSIGTGSPAEIERYWSAFVLYCVMKLSSGKSKEEGGVTLCQILRTSKLNVVDFFKEIPQFSLKAGRIISGLYGSNWEKRLELKEQQENVIHLSLLSRYYRRAYQEFFLSNESNSSQQLITSSSGYVSDYHRFGWLLFLALRVHVFSRYKDLVTCTNILVSILAMLILHVPVHFRNFDIQTSTMFATKSDKGVNLLACLCHKYDTSEEELKKTLDTANSLIADILKKKACPASEYKKETLDNIDTDGLTYFEDLLDKNSLQAMLIILEEDYENIINVKGELDERLFVNDEESLLGSGSLSGGAINLSGTKRKLDAVASPTKTITSSLSPLRSPAQPLNGHSKIGSMTPISTAMATAKWLRDVISPLPSRPSAQLERFFTSCDSDLTSDITRRSKVILEAIFLISSFGERCISGSLQSANLMDSIWAEQRKMEALKLYYRVLVAMCRAESQTLSGNNLTSLLSNERFHRCMLACSAELVVASHKTISVTFSEILERTGITAFDLSKVIESFVRHEETLPRELKRHLNSLEERLLESIAWEKGSSMYNSLIVARQALSSEINRLGLLAEPMPSIDAIALRNSILSGVFPNLPSKKMETSPDQNGDPRSPKRPCTELRNVLAERNQFTSPVKERLLACTSLKCKLAPLQSAFASPTRPNPVGEGETCAETGINIFLGKITKLAAIRIKSLWERLQLSQQILEQVYSLVQQILSQRTSLFFNRHIDQIILCSFYGVAKISQLSLTFKEIIYNYRKQPQCKPQVFRSVYVNWLSTSRNGKTGEEHVDIITFYNEVFIPSVKPLLVELGLVGSTQKPNKLPEDRNGVDGHIPGSPRVTFPSLPDMSPKKVSAAYNVYVSPLRASKMETLLSPSSKSYYACVGESTHAYQSPSKDLTAINNRLNGGRKVNARLNFDMVSDSVVAGSFGQQNGSSVSPAAATNNISPPPMKYEQPDS